MTKKILPLTLALVLFSFCALGSGSDDESDKGTIKNESSSESASSEESSAEDAAEDTETNNVVRKGGTFEKDGLQIKFKGIKKNYKPSDDKYHFHKAGKGKKYIACTFAVKNKGKADQYISSSEFSCYADDESCESEYITTDDFKNSDFVNDNLSSGRKVEFTVFYSVPKKAKSIQLEYEPSFWSDEKIIFEVAK